MNFDYRRTKRLMMKRRNISRYRKEQRNQKNLQTPGSKRNYITPGISSREISRASSLERTTNTNSASTATSRQEGSPPLNPLPKDPAANSMAWTDIRLPTFNGNGIEYPKQHWFLYEVVWMVHLVHNMDIRKAHMFMTLRGHALYWFIKFYDASGGTPQKTLDEI